MFNEGGEAARSSVERSTCTFTSRTWTISIANGKGGVEVVEELYDAFYREQCRRISAQGHASATSSPGSYTLPLAAGADER